MEDGSLTVAAESENDIAWDLLNIPTYKKRAYDAAELYQDIITLSKRVFVLSKEVEYKIYALWLMATWKVHRFNTVSFLSFVSPHNSGKTILLEGIRAMGNKAVLSSNTAVVIPKLSHTIGVLPLIDEAHELNANDKTLFTFLKSSYRRGSKYIKSKEGTDTDIVALDNFGFKAFAGEEGFGNSALADRCISINPEIEGIPEVQKLSYVQMELDSIRDRLLLFAMEDKFVFDLGNDYTTLSGRTRELYEPLIAVAKHIGIDYSDLEAHALLDKTEKREARSTTIEYEILAYINDTPGTKIMKECIISYLGWKQDTVDARRKAGARLGYQFAKKCHVQITGRGYYQQYIDLSDKETYTKIKKLWDVYNIVQKYDYRSRVKQSESGSVYEIHCI
jgi:hypothetical protein